MTTVSTVDLMPAEKVQTASKKGAICKGTTSKSPDPTLEPEWSNRLKAKMLVSKVTVLTVQQILKTLISLSVSQ